MSINHLKVILTKQRKTNLKLTREFGKESVIVSKWCLETLTAIAECLNVDIRSLLNSTNHAMVAEPSISYGNHEQV